MIKTSMQLKALVRNKSGGDNTKALSILRNYVMERFLERVSLSKYRDHFVLKGGAYIASIVGLNNRSTMDLDATLLKVRLDEMSVRTMIEEIMSIPLEDCLKFSITNVTSILENSSYPGVRVTLNASLDVLQITMKLDFSTGDVISPKEIDFDFKFMFEERSVSVLAYTIETVLAEKFETILSFGTANSRMRDFYDIYVLSSIKNNFNKSHFALVLMNTTRHRGSTELIKEKTQIIEEISSDEAMIRLWSSYCAKFDFARDILWKDVIDSVKKLSEISL